MIFYISIQTYLIVDLELLKTKEYFLLVCHTRCHTISPQLTGDSHNYDALQVLIYTGSR